MNFKEPQWPKNFHTVKYVTYQLIKRLTSTSASGPTILISDHITKIKDLVLKGLDDKAIKLYNEQVYPLFPNHESTIFVLPSIIKACSHSQMHEPLCLQLHCNAIKNGYDSESTVSNSLITMYAKLSDVKSAYKMFDTMPHRDTISWNSIVNCCIQNGDFLESFKLFEDMYASGFVPKPALIASILSACVNTENAKLGRIIHARHIVDERLETSVFVSTALVDYYFKCNDQPMAFRVFGRMEVRNVVSWTAMIAGCVANLDYEKALDCFRAMQVTRNQPNRVTLMSILPAFATLGSIRHGKEIHGYAIQHGFDKDFRFSSALMHMYFECGREFKAAKLIFDRSMIKDVVMWSCMIEGYSRNEDSAEEAIKLFNKMQKEGIQPNDVTLLAVISACTVMLSIGHARGVHGYVLKSCFISVLNIQNSLISMYAKCGAFGDSVQIFKEMPLTDYISWSAIISACSLYGYARDALQLFHEMQKQGIKVDAITVLEIITACDHAGLIEEGHEFFDEVMKNDNISLTLEHYACYINLLGRAGKLDEACELVCRMPLKPSASIWTSLVSSCKLHGRLEVAELLARRLIESDPGNAGNYNLLSMINSELDNWHGAEEVRRSMKDRKLIKNYGFSRI